jgi:superfamily II DNA or RNA helicase
MELRPYQKQGEDDIYDAWDSGYRNVLYILPTGGGKTYTFSDIVRKFRGETVIIAHRETLLSQISLSLAKLGVYHRILSPDKVIKEISFANVEIFNKSFIDPLASITVGGVDTMARRLKQADFQAWAVKVKLWILDEAHHCLKKNKWGKVIANFPNAQGLGVTATPTRTDGCGLGSDNDGVFDTMVEGPTMSHLIQEGYLVPYKIFCPPSDFNVSNVKITATGEFNQKQLNIATMESKIMGDVVIQYLKYAKGLRGLTFCPSIELAKIVTEKYNMAGVKAKLITADTKQRRQTIQSLTDGTIKQIVSIDTLGEGMDVPNVEVCSFLRKTESLGLYMQQFGRGMRISPGKKHLIILDHVGNVIRHHLPDTDRKWTLDKKNKKANNKFLLLIVCLSCFQPFEPFMKDCPHCGCIRIRGKRSNPIEVDGDLTQLTDEILSQMRSDIYKIDNPVTPGLGHSDMIRRAIIKRQNKRKYTQVNLRLKISQWAGNMKHLGKNDSEIYMLFFNMTGIDTMKAQTLGARQATELMENIQ